MDDIRKSQIRTACLVLKEYARDELYCVAWLYGELCKDCPVCKGELTDVLGDVINSLTEEDSLT